MSEAEYDQPEAPPKQAPNRQHTVSISPQQTIVTAAHHSAPRQASRWMRAEPLISRDTHASLGVVPHHGGRSDALQDNEPAMTEVPKPLLCTVKWGVDGVIGGVLHLHAVADIHAEDRIWGRWLANSACEHVQIKPPPTPQMEGVSSRCLRMSAI